MLCMTTMHTVYGYATNSDCETVKTQLCVHLLTCVLMLDHGVICAHLIPVY